MQRRNRDIWVILAVIALLVVAAVALVWTADDKPTVPLDTEPDTTPRSAPHTPGSSPSGGARPSGTASPEGRPSRAGQATAPGERGRRGIDASHHQGPIDWKAVAGDQIDFAYLKATEGTRFVDPRFAEHRRAAREAGVRVGGYHYFQLCQPGEEQARHFARTLGSREPGDLPPAVDLELAGSCPNPPSREVLLAEVRAFLHVVERASGQQIVVYLYPEFDERYGFSREIDRRLWLRKLGPTPPAGDWWLWQQSETGRVAGITGNVDINVLRQP